MTRNKRTKNTGDKSNVNENALTTEEGAASAAPSSESEPSVDEKLSSMSSAMTDVARDLDQRMVGVEDDVVSINEQLTAMSSGMSEVLKALKAINNPVIIRKSVDVDGESQSGVAEVATNAEGEPIIVESGLGDINSPRAQQEFATEAFMNEPVTVHIHEASDPNAAQVFTVLVNGKEEIFIRNQSKTVKRMFVEQLARCRPVNYRNEKYTNADGDTAYRYPRARSTRYPFSIVQDTQKGMQWFSELQATL